MNSQSTSSASGQLMTMQDATAKAIAFNEEVGLGAISKTGALPMGSDGEWLALAEKKLKKDQSLDYQSLLWELGSEVAENDQLKNGGLNITLEENLLKNMVINN